MTDLSPAAQAVFWEFNRAASGKPDDWHYLPAIAAALRAVNDHLSMGSPYTGCDEDEGVIWACNELLAIATELDKAASFDTVD
jgi:hypothetical protein